MDKNTSEVIEQCESLSVANALVDDLEDTSLIIKKEGDFEN
ncbi:hypothetical protein [Pseudolactococcus yaeyamensis]